MKKINLVFIKNINKKIILYTIFLGISISLFFNTFIDIINIKQIFNYDNSFNEKVNSINIYLAIFIIGILAPIVEEIIYRKIIYNIILKNKLKINIYLSMIIASTLFAIFHGNIPQGIFAFFAGFIFVLIYEWNDNIIIPIICHLSANLATFFLYNETYLYDFRMKLFIILISFTVILFSIYAMYKIKKIGEKNEIN